MKWYRFVAASLLALCLPWAVMAQESNQPIVTADSDNTFFDISDVVLFAGNFIGSYGDQRFCFDNCHEISGTININRPGLYNIVVLPFAEDMTDGWDTPITEMNVDRGGQTCRNHVAKISQATARIIFQADLGCPADISFTIMLGPDAEDANTFAIILVFLLG